MDIEPPAEYEGDWLVFRLATIFGVLPADLKGMSRVDAMMYLSLNRYGSYCEQEAFKRKMQTGY